MMKGKKVHYTFCTMQNIELCRYLCNENKVVTEDNITTIESDVTCKRCLQILQKMKISHDKKQRLREDRLKKTEEKQTTKEESDKKTMQFLDMFDKVVGDSWKDVNKMFDELDRMHDNKKIVKVEIKKTFDDGTHTTEVVNMRR